MLRKRTAHGFSLMELLIVIALIAFMLGFLTMVFINNQKDSKNKAAKALLHKLEIGLSRYYEAFREYPPDTGYGLDQDPAQNRGTMGNVVLYDPGSLYRYLGQKVDWKKPSENGGLVEMGSYGPFLEFTPKELKAYTDPQYGESNVVIDPWMHPIGYIGDKRRKIHNKDGVDLFSAGADGRTASDDAPGSPSNGPNGPFDHGWSELPNGAAYGHDNQAYDASDNDGDGIADNATEMGYSVLNGCLTATKKHKIAMDSTDKNARESLDDINNWDPEK